MKVKVGHGGTLDPLATGVLIIGVGKGTKSLSKFLGCTKTYEVDLLFGAATDTYDVLGKVLNRAPFVHITKDRVENELERFRGNIMQRPPIYSALRIQGKHLYEYARDGKEVPVEIQERPVTVHNLQITNWLVEHDYEWPSQEANVEEKIIAEHIEDPASCTKMKASDPAVQPAASALAIYISKRKRSQDSLDESMDMDEPPAIRPRRAVESLITNGHETSITVAKKSAGVREVRSTSPACPIGKPPVISLRMTVSSGFYVRSLCHDLGKAVGSLGIMAKLVRTRQGDFEIGRNVLDYDKLEMGEEVWRPDVEIMLHDWSQIQKAAGIVGEENKPDPGLDSLHTAGIKDTLNSRYTEPKSL